MSNDRPWGMELRSFLLLLHLSQFAGTIVPGAGFILPIVMWVTNREANQQVNEHGKEIVNWIISLVIYAIIGGVLMIIGIGFIILIVLGILAIVFPIVGAINANNGEFWRYPLNMRLIK